MNRTTRIAATAGAFVATGLAATVLNSRAQVSRRLRRGEDVEFGSVHSTPLAVIAPDGVSINVEVDEADRRTPVVVFAHGWVCTLDTWHYQRLAMRGAVRMVFMDQRSHGASGRSGASSSSLSDMASDLATVIAEVAPRGPVILVGHSMGGMAIMQLAIDDPDLFERRVRGVVLLSTSSGRLMRGSPALRRIVPLLRVASPVLEWGRSFNSFSIIKRWGLGPGAHERHVDMTNEMLLRAPLHVLTDFYPNFVGLDLTSSLALVAGAHTTVVCGTEDQLTPLAHSRRLAEAIDGARLVEVKGAGHMVIFEEHEQVVDVIHRSFGARKPLDPASTAMDETVESVREVLAGPGGLLVQRRDHPMGALLFDESRAGLLGLRRVAVDPDLQDRGVASAMVGVAEDTAEERGKDGIWLHVREELPETVRFWSRRYYHEVRQEGPLIEFAKTLWLSREVPTPDLMKDLARRVARLLHPGDLLVLSGDLGAGKTTFTQGLGDALAVRGPITSPTFVIAREHPSLVDGPSLVHVDAYRLGDATEIDDLDLDATSEKAITVVEWGDGMAEQLNDSWLHVRIEVRGPRPIDPLGTPHEGTIEPEPADDMDPRVVTIKPRGPRWAGVPLRSTVLADSHDD